MEGANKKKRSGSNPAKNKKTENASMLQDCQPIKNEAIS